MTLQLRPTFSESWYRVKTLKAKLRSSAQITRQFYRGERWYVVRDPAGNQFHRLSDPAYRFVALLDGRRTVEEAWDLAGGQLEDDAPTQPEVIQILSHLYSANLIDADVTPDATVLLRRHKQLSKRKMQNRLMNVLFPRIPLWDPDRFLKRWLPLVRVLFSKFGAIVWLFVVIGACARVLPMWNEQGHSLKQAAVHSVDVRSNPVNLVLLWGVFVLIKLIHELGHAFSCRRFGGECHELGIMFLVFIPTPYVDASSAWSFANKWHRIFVGAGGMIVELFFASLCAFIWAGVDPNGLVGQLAFNAMLVASVTTVIFNANPLLRYDGYYILSDFLEIPNLRQKSTEYTLGLLKRHVFRVKQQQPLPPALQRFWLFTYAVTSSIYRAFVGFAILLLVAYELPVIGPLMAVSGILTWFLVPVFKIFKYLTIEPELHRKRGRAIAFSLAVAAAIVVLIGLVKFPMSVESEGVLRVPDADTAVVHARQPGFVDHIEKGPNGQPWKDGDVVTKGTPILVLRNPEIDTQVAMTTARVRELTLQLTQSTTVNATLREVARETLKETIEQRDLLKHKQDELTIRAPIDGQLIAPQLPYFQDQYMEQSAEILKISNTQHQIVQVLVDQREYQLLEDQQNSGRSLRAEGRVAGDVPHIIPASAIRLVPAAQDYAPHPLLTNSGGGEAQMDPTDRSPESAHSARLASPQFQAWVLLDDSTVNYLPGQRAYVKFRLDKKPLIWQWGRRFWQLIQAKGGSSKWL